MTKPVKYYRELYLFSKKKEPLVEDWFSQNLIDHIDLNGWNHEDMACHWFTRCLEEFDIHALHATRVINFSQSGVPFAMLSGSFDAILQINGVLTIQKVKSFLNAIHEINASVESLEESLNLIKSAQRLSGFSKQQPLKTDLKTSRKNSELALEAAKSAQAMLYDTFTSTFSANNNGDDL